MELSSEPPLWGPIHGCAMDLRTHTATRSTLAKENGRAIDEPVELKNLVVNSTSVDNVRNSSRLVNGELHCEAESLAPERDLQPVAGCPRLQSQHVPRFGKPVDPALSLYDLALRQTYFDRQPPPVTRVCRELEPEFPRGLGITTLSRNGAPVPGRGVPRS